MWHCVLCMRQAYGLYLKWPLILLYPRKCFNLTVSFCFTNKKNIFKGFGLFKFLNNKKTVQLIKYYNFKCHPKEVELKWVDSIRGCFHMVPVFNWSYESFSAKHQQCVIIICVYTSTGISEQLHCLRHTVQVTAVCVTMTSEDFHLLYTDKMLAYVGQVLKSIMFQFCQGFLR